MAQNWVNDRTNVGRVQVNFELDNIAWVTQLSLEGKMFNRDERIDPTKIENVFSNPKEIEKEKGG